MNILVSELIFLFRSIWKGIQPSYGIVRKTVKRLIERQVPAKSMDINALLIVVVLNFLNKQFGLRNAKSRKVEKLKVERTFGAGRSKVREEYAHLKSA